MAKDLGLALDAAKSVGAPMPTGATAFQVFQLMLQSGLANKDFSSVYAFLNGQVRRLCLLCGKVNAFEPRFYAHHYSITSAAVCICFRRLPT